MTGARLVAIAAVVLALTVGILLWSRTGDAPPAPPSAGPAPAPTPAVAASAPGAATAREAAVAVPAPADALTTAMVRGRCLAAEDGRAVAATLRIGNDDGAPVDEPGALAHAALATVVADANGHFACAVPVAAATDLRVHAEAKGRAPAGARQLGVGPGGTWDLGDIRLVRTAAVRGDVVDATGAPVALAEVGLVMLGQEMPTLSFRDSHTTATDERGAFAFAAPLAAGEWYVRVERTGALRTPRKVMVPGEGEVVVRIEVERPDPALTLHGKVVDRNGLPLAGVALAAYGEGARGSAVSGADGTFVLPKGPPHFDRGLPGVELQASLAGHEQASPSKGEIPTWGRRDLVVVMRPLGDLVVRALDARGAAVWPFTVTVGKLAASGETWHARSAARQAAGDGRVVLQQLASGAYTLLLVPQDRSLATTGPVPFRVDEHTGRELVVRVPDRSDVLVEVVDDLGAPVPDCRLELVASLTANQPDAKAPAPDLAAARAATVPGPRQLAVASARTDLAGRATLPAAPGPWLLRARCTTHQPAALPITVAPGGPVQRLVLTRAAVVHGRLLPREALPALGLDQQKPERRLAVVALAGKDQVARAEVTADGTFVLGPLPPSVVTLQLATWLAANDVSNATMPHGLGTVDGAATGSIERSFDVGPFAPATVTGRVLWNGEPLRHGQFFLRRLQPEPVRFVRVPTDGEGRFRTLVPPGSLGPQLAIPSDPGPGHVTLPLDERHEVAAGQTLELHLAANARALRLRVQGPDGTPMANARLQIVADGYQRPGTLSTDASGSVEVAMAPYSAFVVTAKDPGGTELAAQCPATAGLATGVVEVRLAKPDR